MACFLRPPCGNIIATTGLLSFGLKKRIMSKDTQVRFREDPKIKRKAAVIFRSMGLDISSACRAFLRQVIKTKSIPFRMESGLTPEGEQMILDADHQLTEDLKSGRAKVYDDTKALFDDLNRGK